MRKTNNKNYTCAACHYKGDMYCADLMAGWHWVGFGIEDDAILLICPHCGTVKVDKFNLNNN